MAVLPVQWIPPVFPEGYCPASLQIFANDLASGSRINSPISTDNIVISDTAPADHTKLWFKTVATLPTAPYNLFYWHAGLGAWVSPNPETPSGDSRRLWIGILAGVGSLEYYDGGSPGAVTATTGPMWEEDINFRGRSPMGPGALPLSNPVQNLAVGADLGAGSHLMAEGEMFEHAHNIGFPTWHADGNTYDAAGGLLSWQITVPTPVSQTMVTEKRGGTDEMSLVHPVRGCYVIKRSLRQFYTG